MTSTPPGNSSTNYKGFPSSSPLFGDGISAPLNALEALEFDHEQYIQQQQQQQQQQQLQRQDEDGQQRDDVGSLSRAADELLDFVPISVNMDPGLQYPIATNGERSNIRESLSNSTISSFNSMTNRINPSVSSTSINNNLNLLQTPLRTAGGSSVLRRKSVGTLMTTPAQTPVRRADMFTTTPRRLTASSSGSLQRRSRLSDKSPVNGNNPFYTPPSFLSPKITKQHRKHASITTSLSLNHLDTDIQLQQQISQQNRLSISPLATPLRTPMRTPSMRMDGLQDEAEGSSERKDDDEDDDDGEDMDPTKSFIEPSLLMKESSSSSQNTGAKFGGKLSDLDTYGRQQKLIQQQQMQLEQQRLQQAAVVTDQGTYDSPTSFINQDFLNNPQDIMLLIDSDNVEDAHNGGLKGSASMPNTSIASISSSSSGYSFGVQPQLMHNRIPRTKSMPPQGLINAGHVAPQVLRRKLTRSRSTMNLSEIAASKEAKTAALRTSSIHQSFTISELPEAAYSREEVEQEEQEQQAKQAHQILQSQQAQQAGQVQQVQQSSEYLNVFPQGIYNAPANPLVQYLTPPSTASSGSNGRLLREAEGEEADGSGSNSDDGTGSSKSMLEHRRGKGRTRKPTTLVLSDFERSKLDLPEQSARSKSRSKKGDNEKKRIHECPLCHSRFQRPEHVKRHMRSHSSEKPFACTQPNCGKRFNRKDNLKQHLRKIHGLEP